MVSRRFSFLCNEDARRTTSLFPVVPKDACRKSGAILQNVGLWDFYDGLHVAFNVSHRDFIFQCKNGARSQFLSSYLTPALQIATRNVLLWGNSQTRVRPLKSINFCLNQNLDIHVFSGKKKFGKVWQWDMTFAEVLSEKTSANSAVIYSKCQHHIYITWEGVTPSLSYNQTTLSKHLIPCCNFPH